MGVGYPGGFFSRCPSWFYRQLKCPFLWLAEGVCKMTSWYLYYLYFLNAFWTWPSGKWDPAVPEDGGSDVPPARSTGQTQAKLLPGPARGAAEGAPAIQLTPRCCHFCNASGLCFMVTELLGKKKSLHMSQDVCLIYTTVSMINEDCRDRSTKIVRNCVCTKAMTCSALATGCRHRVHVLIFVSSP